MTQISLVVAIDENRGIGYENALLCYLPADLKHFKAVTLGKPIIMGYKTYQSIGRPLPGRLNIVLTRQNRNIDGVTVVHSLEQAIELTQSAAEVMVIGGESLFEESLPLAQQIYLTLIHHQFKADTFFPPIDIKRWSRQELFTQQHDQKNPYDMTFYLYKKLTGPKDN